ncbi:hypothetical protein SDC9_169356 [bioreactor metagenome]|uniref:Uncharacterized protein n=1 Tax=bioreactor metagenome TaxID=1076179 RepID=A0A645GD81_9ZZZZ
MHVAKALDVFGVNPFAHQALLHDGNFVGTDAREMFLEVGLHRIPVLPSMQAQDEALQNVLALLEFRGTHAGNSAGWSNRYC